MGDPARQLPECLEPLRFPQNRLALIAFGHVAHGQHETTVGHGGAPKLEAPSVGSAGPVVDDGLARHAAQHAIPDLGFGLQQAVPAYSGFRQVSGNDAVRGSGSDRLRRQREQNGKTRIAAHQRKTGIEDSDALADTVKRGAELRRQCPLLAFREQKLLARGTE